MVFQLYGDIMYTKSKQDNGLAPSPFAVQGASSYFNTAVFVPFLDPRTGMAFGNLPGPGGSAAEHALNQKITDAAQLAIIQNSPFNPFPGRQASES